VNEHQQEISWNNFEDYVSEGVKCSLRIIHPVIHLCLWLVLRISFGALTLLGEYLERAFACKGICTTYNAKVFFISKRMKKTKRLAHPCLLVKQPL